MNRFDDPDLTRRILARTSGPACGRAETLLASRLDGALAADDVQLLEAHLGRCAPCRALAAALAWSAPLLPELADRDPGPAFTRQVLDRTTGAARRAAARWARLERGAEALRERLVRWWARPRFAWEAAYVGTLVVALAIWGPLAPSGTAEAALSAARESGQVVPALVQRAEKNVPALGGALVAPLAEPAGKVKQTAETGLDFWRRLVEEAFASDDDPGKQDEAAPDGRP